MSQSQSPLDGNNEIFNEIEYGLTFGRSYEEIAHQVMARFGIVTSSDSIRRYVRRNNLQSRLQSKDTHKGVEVDGDTATVVGPKTAALLHDPSELIRERGLNPEEWEIERVKINEWDSPTGETLKQLTVHLTRVKPVNMIFPAREPGKYKAPKLESKKNSDEPSLVVLVGDQQAPYHDPKLHSLFLQWLSVNKPDRGVLIGDTIDLPDISRHPDNPEWGATTQECIDAAYLLLREYVQSSEETRWTKLAGNHDERLRRAVIDRLSDLYGLRRAAVPGLPQSPAILDVAHLLRLDELGIDYVLPNGGYNNAHIQLSPYLAARHGWIATKNSGSSAMKTLEHLGYSVVVGHCHRQSLVFKTKHDLDGTVQTLVGAEIGCMCKIDDGLGYAVAPDWQAGFATAVIFPSGKFHLELATFVNGALYYRDQRYQ